MKIVFDLDNTLYSFDETGIDTFMRNNIVQYIVDHLKFSEDEARAMSEQYYAEYGLCIAGLAQHHGVDTRHYCDFVHRFDMSVVKEDPGITAVLEELQRRGHELWVFTNADVPHATRMLDGLKLRRFFEEEAGSGALRAIDCFAQWDHSSPSFHNKPEPTAYQCAAKVMNVQPGEPVMMLDDSMLNLRAPHDMGWISVWIAHGRPAPADCKHHVLQTVHGLLDLMETIKVPAEQPSK